ncbi:acyl-CoA dehydrogenase family protein [Ramlibacter albus]|uniref:Acyl-CoA dehydrogenase family protein n=1 Tax=Ramlibacter albus TaxID=2079448 RepID=A0A923MDJ7_9BURK|nr:acyl-CoA dehydrogenase family protein [Ramlibacter albus]MBC5767072.1 acyl-CoA dehydrogenase family protein [Ramlibacter albus]
MELQLDPGQTAFREEVRAFLRERLPPEVRERMRKGLRPSREQVVQWQRVLHERGWAAPHWPREFGGADLGQMERLILMDELQLAPAPLPLHFNVTMLGPVLLKYGTPEQKRDWLPRLARLDVWFCQGFSEPGAGSDLASLRTSARREGDNYIVNGQKIWTTYAHMADWIFCLVRTNPDAARKQEGISFLLIDLKTPGITIRPIHTIDGEHHLNEVFFDDVKVPAANIVGEENKGWDVTKTLLGSERTGLAYVGASRDRLDRTIELARELGVDRDPLIQSEIAWLDAELRGLEVTNLRLLLSAQAQHENPAFASVLKLKGVAIQQQIAQLMLRVAGPSALARHDDENGVPATRYFFTRASSIYGGTSEVQKDVLAKTILS